MPQVPSASWRSSDLPIYSRPPLAPPAFPCTRGEFGSNTARSWHHTPAAEKVTLSQTEGDRPRSDPPSLSCSVVACPTITGSPPRSQIVSNAAAPPIARTDMELVDSGLCEVVDELQRTNS